MQTLSPGDPLGRYVPSKTRAVKAAKGGTVAYDLFIEKDAESLSVDRLDVAPDTDMAAIADENIDARGRVFYGWAVVTVQQARDMSRTVESTPQLNNPYHADIFLDLPDDGAERRDAAKAHAYNLATHARYRPRP